MNRYETAVVLDPEMGEEERESVVGRLTEAISQFSGDILDREDWGVRKLAYSVKRRERGYYFFLRYSGGPGVVEEVERLLRINEKVLRFLTTKYEKDIKGKYPLPPAIEEVMERDLLEFLSTKAQWRRSVASSPPAGTKVEKAKPEKSAEDAPPGQDDKAESPGTEGGGTETEE